MNYKAREYFRTTHVAGRLGKEVKNTKRILVFVNLGIKYKYREVMVESYETSHWAAFGV